MALEKFNIYQESTSAKLSELKNQWETFWTNAFSSDVFKGFIDAGTGILSFANKVGALPTLLAALSLSLTLVSTKARMLNVTVGQDGVKQWTVFGRAAQGATGGCQHSRLVFTEQESVQ